MHLPDSVRTYIRFRWISGVLILGPGLYLCRSLLLPDRSISDFAPTAVHLSVLWAALGILSLLWVVVDFFCYRYYWRHRLAVGYLHQMAIHMFPRPHRGEDPTRYLWAVYRTAPTLSARLVAAEWIGVMGGLSLAGSSQNSRSRSALREALAAYQRNLDQGKLPSSPLQQRGRSGELGIDLSPTGPFGEAILQSPEVRHSRPKAVS